MALQPIEAAITVQPGQTCLEEARLERRTARWLERDMVDARIRVDVFGGDTPQDVRFVVRRMGDEPAHRKLQSVPEPCDQLHAAVALSVALAIDATLLDAPEVSDEALKLDEVTDDPPPPDEPLLPPPPPGPNAYQPRVAAGVLAGVTSGVVPGPAAGGSAFAAFGPVSWLELRLGAMGTGAAGFGFPVPGSYSAWLAAGRVDACAITLAHSAFRIGTCVGAAVGRFVTQGNDDFPGGGFHAASLWSAIVATASGELHLGGPVWMALELSLCAPLQTRQTDVRWEDGALYARTVLAPVAFMGTLGPALRFDL